jgi:hypothetical protein
MTKHVRENHPGFYSKPISKWWDGYTDEEVVLVDDVDPSHATLLTYFLKIWTDHYALPAEVKGGKRYIRPQTIIVTSQYTIEECFASADKATRDAIMRRFKTTALSNERVIGALPS